MSDLYIILRTYTPDSAAGIRFKSLLEGFSESNRKITVVLFAPDSNRSRLEISSENINVLKLWTETSRINKVAEKIRIIFRISSFCHRLKKGDSVLVMGYSEILPFLFRVKGINIFYEITECPEVSLTQFRYFGTKVKDFIKYCKKLTGLFVISESLKTYFIEHGIEQKKIHVINMTVDAKRFIGVIKESNERYIAYCGNASNYKDGVDDLIRSFAVVVKKNPNVKLYIIGNKPGQGQSFKNLELAEKLGIAEKVVFTGKLSPNQIPQLLKNAEVLALERPDNIQAKYGFPTKLGEYLMTGNPVVLTDVGDISRFLTNGKSAIIVPPGDTEKFADGINWALDNSKEAKLMGTLGQSVALSCFNGKNEGLKLINYIFNERV